MKDPRLSNETIDPADVPDWALRYESRHHLPFAYTADVVGLAVDLEKRTLDALLIERGQDPFVGFDAWPGGFVDWADDDTAAETALRELDEEASQGEVDYIETLNTYDRNGRDPRQFAGHPDPVTGCWVRTGNRVVSNAKLGLFRKAGRVLQPREGEDARRSFWRSVYDYLPWEDLREQRGRTIRSRVIEQLRVWAEQGDEQFRDDRLRRIAFAWGTNTDTDWNEERADERYALLLEAGLVEEALRDRWGRVPAGASRPSASLFGRPMAFDHRLMMADALTRLRGKIKYTPALLAALLPDRFTLTDLQHACEAIGGRRLHKQNFRRVVAQSQSFRIVEPTGELNAIPRPRGGRASALYRFPSEVRLMRLDPSIRMPWVD